MDLPATSWMQPAQIYIYLLITISEKGLVGQGLYIPISGNYIVTIKANDPVHEVNKKATVDPLLLKVNE